MGGIKDILKGIRSFPLINIPIRSIIKSKTGFNQKIFNFFSLHWPVSGIIKFKLPGGEIVKMSSKSDDYISTQVFWKGYMGYEGASAQLFYYLSRQCSSILDIGANVGYFTLIASIANPKAKVYTFEPARNIFERLLKNIKLNSLSNVIAENSVVGNTNTTVKFYLPKVSGIALAGSAVKGWHNDTEEINIPSVSLDMYKKANSIDTIKLIKMDCEFYEKQVLEGMETILQEDKPIIIMEVLFPEGEGQKGHFEVEAYKEIEDIMKRNGYYFYLINNSALIRLDKLEYNPDERNYLFSTKRSEKIYNSYLEMDTLIKNVL
jgi:FkbM family methyltransferase